MHVSMMNAAGRLRDLTFILLLALAPRPVVAAPACAPACREGFTCLQGKCVTACNPPCAAGERCTADLRCLPAETLAQPVRPAPVAPPPPPPSAPAPAPAPPPTPAPAGEHRGYQIGLAAGALFPGTIDFDAGSVDTSSGLVGRLSADVQVAPRFGVGAYLLVASFKMLGESGTVTGLGATAKGYFALGPKLVFRPGLSIGYQSASVASSTDTAKGLGISALAELAMPLTEGLNGFVQLSFISQPSGGVSGVTDVTWAPILFLTVGLELAR